MICEGEGGAEGVVRPPPAGLAVGGKWPSALAVKQLRSVVRPVRSRWIETFSTTGKQQQLIFDQHVKIEISLI